MSFALIVAEPSSVRATLCGITLLERLLRTLERADVQRAVIVSSDPESIVRALPPAGQFRPRLVVDISTQVANPATTGRLLQAWDAAGHAPNGRAVLLPADAVFDARILRALTATEGPTALVDSAPPARWRSLVEQAPRTRHGFFCRAMAVDQAWLAGEDAPVEDRGRREADDGRLRVLDAATLPDDSRELRRRLRPFWFPAPDALRRGTAKRLLLDAAQKGAQDIPALVHAPIETWLVGRLCETRVTPNHLTLATNVTAWGVTALFATGHIGWGAAGALVVGVFDGLDGKQARVKLETSKAGELEHWFDFVFEASWWISLAASLRRSGLLPGAFLWLLVLYASELVDGLAKWAVKRTCGRSIDEMGAPHRLVRLLGGRRNVYVWILAAGVWLGQPATAYVVLASWEAVTAALHVPLAAWTLRAGPGAGIRKSP